MLVASAVLPIDGRPARMIEIGRLQSAHLAVEIAQAGGDARQPAVALIGVVRPSRWHGQRGVERQEALAVLARLGQREEAAFGVLDLLLGRKVDRRIEGDVDHVLADHDQLRGGRRDRRPCGRSRAALMMVVGVGRQPAEILRHRQVRRRSARRSRRRSCSVIGRRLLARADQLGRRLVDAARAADRRNARAPGSSRRGRAPRC